MAAYVIADFEITDLAGIKEYLRRVAATIDQYGGRYLVRGEIGETIEGDWRSHRLVILEFEGVEQAKRWYDSPEYAAIKGIHHKTARTQLVFVPGESKV